MLLREVRKEGLRELPLDVVPHRGDVLTRPRPAPPESLQPPWTGRPRVVSKAVRFGVRPTMHFRWPFLSSSLSAAYSCRHRRPYPPSSRLSSRRVCRFCRRRRRRCPLSAGLPRPPSLALLGVPPACPSSSTREAVLSPLLLFFHLHFRLALSVLECPTVGLARRLVRVHEIRTCSRLVKISGTRSFSL